MTSALSLASWVVLLVSALFVGAYSWLVRSHTVELSNAARLGNRMTEMSIFWVLRWQLTFMSMGCVALVVVATIEIAGALFGQ